MQTLSSASRTFIALASAVECTATVLMPMSWQARWMRNAISPRLVIRTLSNIRPEGAVLFDQHQRRAIFNRLGVADINVRHAATTRRTNLVHHLHRLDDHQRLALGDGIADPHIRQLTRLGGDRK